MRIVIQRVKEARVSVAGAVVGSIDCGLMVLVGVECGDTADDVKWLVAKTAALRIFDDANGVMNLPITAVAGARVLAVSQFTLTASTRKGSRPSYIRAARGEEARSLYDLYCDMLAGLLTAAIGREQRVERGVFGADMAVSLINDGPVTIIIDSRLRE